MCHKQFLKQILIQIHNSFRVKMSYGKAVKMIFYFFLMNIFDIFLIFAQNIDCGYTLEPPQ